MGMVVAAVSDTGVWSVQSHGTPGHLLRLHHRGECYRADDRRGNCDHAISCR